MMVLFREGNKTRSTASQRVRLEWAVKVMRTSCWPQCTMRLVQEFVSDALQRRFYPSWRSSKVRLG